MTKVIGFLKRAAGTVVAAIVLWVAGPVAAVASGTIEIHHTDGTVNVYDDVDIRVFSGSLFLTTDDGDGTIVVTSAACWYQGKVIACLPTNVAAVQNGKSRALDLRSGTIYLNYTDGAQPMMFTSQKIPAHSVLFAFSTTSGTVVTLRGVLDQVVRMRGMGR